MKLSSYKFVSQKYQVCRTWKTQMSHSWTFKLWKQNEESSYRYHQHQHRPQILINFTLTQEHFLPHCPLLLASIFYAMFSVGELEFWPFKCQSHNMVKHTQTIRRQKPTNCSSVFNHFVGLALKELNINLPFIKDDY